MRMMNRRPLITRLVRIRALLAEREPLDGGCRCAAAGSEGWGRVSPVRREGTERVTAVDRGKGAERRCAWGWIADRKGGEGSGAGNRDLRRARRAWGGTLGIINFLAALGARI